MAVAKEASIIALRQGAVVKLDFARLLAMMMAAITREPSWPATRELVPASFEGRDLEFLDAISLALGISDTKQRRFQGGNSLLSLLERFSTQLSSDLRDLVYSLVGLEDTTSTMEIDYDLELREVFTNAAIHIIEDIGDLSVLAFGGSVLGLPLWVLDWRAAR